MTSKFVSFEEKTEEPENEIITWGLDIFSFSNNFFALINNEDDENYNYDLNEEYIYSIVDN